MGSAYYGPNSDCYHCTGCGTYRPCDDCTANCCQKNMNEHRRLRRLEDTFKDKAYSAKKYVYDVCQSAVNYLKDNHNINILIKSNDNKNFLEKSKDIIDAMKGKKEEINKEASKIKEDRFKKVKIQKIKNDHKKKMSSINEQFCEKMNKINSENISDIKTIENEIEKKQKEKRELQTKRNEIENKYINVLENFKSEKENRLILEFERKRNEIDLKYAFIDNIIEPEFEYSEGEKTEKNNLLQNIKLIQMFSNKLPNYHIIMKTFGISNYLS